MRRNVPSENNFEPIIWATNHWSIFLFVSTCIRQKNDYFPRE